MRQVAGIHDLPSSTGMQASSTESGQGQEVIECNPFAPFPQPHTLSSCQPGLNSTYFAVTGLKFHVYLWSITPGNGKLRECSRCFRMHQGTKVTKEDP